MWIHLLILGVIFGFTMANDVGLAELYQASSTYMAAEHITLSGQFFVLTVAIICVGLFLHRMEAYGLMLFIANCLMELSLFVLTAASLLALFFMVALEKNFWGDCLSTALIPFIGLGASMTILYLFDFNYPFASRLLPALLLFSLSLGLVIVGGMVQQGTITLPF